MKNVYAFAVVTLCFIAAVFHARNTEVDNSLDRLQRMMPQAHVHTWDVWVSDPVTGMILHKPVQCRVCINCGLQEYRTIEASKTP